jgi:hypothetical protein
LRSAIRRGFAAFGLVLFSSSALAAGCVIDSAPCKGFGCKGGPGYRHVASGRCVGFRDLDKKCGTPPGAACIFENAPGAGANRDCALAPRRRNQATE